MSLELPVRKVLWKGVEYQITVLNEDLVLVNTVGTPFKVGRAQFFFSATFERTITGWAYPRKRQRVHTFEAWKPSGKGVSAFPEEISKEMSSFLDVWEVGNRELLRYARYVYVQNRLISLEKARRDLELYLKEAIEEEEILKSSIDDEYPTKEPEDAPSSVD